MPIAVDVGGEVMMKPKLAEFKLTFIMAAVFAVAAVGIWQASGDIFYLYNFAIIGVSVALATGLWPILRNESKPRARRLSQLLVGGYLFFGLGMGFIYLVFGVIVPENMQIEGFWFFLVAGVFQGAVIHYFLAKIIGPTLFNRFWCGWGCWTAAVLDILPWKKSPGRLPGRWGNLRYLHFALALALVLAFAFLLRQGLASQEGVVRLGYVGEIGPKEYQGMFQIPSLWWFMAGNLLYYGSGIVLACVLRDNRAFCKYLCPIVSFLKPASRLAPVRIGARNDKCTHCGLCESHCPMDIQIERYVREGKRVLSTECILCLTCTTVCPQKVLGVTVRPSVSRAEYLRTRPCSPRKG